MLCSCRSGDSRASLEPVASERRPAEESKPSELPASAERCECLHAVASGAAWPIVYEVVLRIVASAVVLAATVAASGTVHAATDTRTATARLTLDGNVLRPEVALTSSQRAVGLMNRQQAPKDGMLFVFKYPTSGGFWMKNTLVPLTIVFFDVHGKRVRRLTMQPCREDPCRIYDPGRVYRFALELPAGDKRPALRLGPQAQLRSLVQRAS